MDDLQTIGKILLWQFGGGFVILHTVWFLWWLWVLFFTTTSAWANGRSVKPDDLDVSNRTGVPYIVLVAMSPAVLLTFVLAVFVSGVELAIVVWVKKVHPKFQNFSYKTSFVPNWLRNKNLAVTLSRLIGQEAK